MSTAPAVPGRRVCARCGANNFDTQAACWKCGTPLNGAAAAAPLAAAPAGNLASSAAPLVPPPGGLYAAPSASRMDPAVAIWSAIALAAFFPLVAVPVGMVFLMLDDRRKTEIGRVTLLWGIVFSVLQYLVTGWIIAAYVRQFSRILPLGGLHLPSRSQAAPDWNQEAPPLQFPGINK